MPTKPIAHLDSFRSDTESQLANPLLNSEDRDRIKDFDRDRSNGDRDEFLQMAEISEVSEITETQVTYTTLATATPNKFRALLTAREKDIHAMWRIFDDSFMRPYFGGRGFVPYVPASPTVRDIGELGLDQVTPFEAIEELPERPQRNSVLRFEEATCVDEGLAESDPAWPEIDHHHRERDRTKRRGVSKDFGEKLEHHFEEARNNQK